MISLKLIRLAIGIVCLAVSMWLFAMASIAADNVILDVKLLNVTSTMLNTISQDVNTSRSFFVFGSIVLTISGIMFALAAVKQPKVVYVQRKYIDDLIQYELPPHEYDRVLVAAVPMQIAQRFYPQMRERVVGYE